ncbi:hypothetical protein [Sporosalibacterium faouarense]|uniref:hypothetical protein n=1 Tax=Sporosalibacterium faouarense TaxID=516123 RepID=UPI00192C2448|nr:hypothetical protein [Sporosalibacterium faouarense]
MNYKNMSFEKVLSIKGSHLTTGTWFDIDKTERKSIEDALHHHFKLACSDIRNAVSL